MQKGDVEFIRDRLLPWANVKSVRIAHSSSTKKWPDIWIQLGEVPVITVTKEWARQGMHERRKRLVHEFLHIKGMDHDDSIGYSTIPAKDSYSMKVYRGLTPTRNPGPIEIEFLCANSDYPDYARLLMKHKRLHERLSGMTGIYPYRQDNSDTHHEYAFAVIVTDSATKKHVLSEAKKIGLPVDMIDNVSENKIDRVVRGEIENQIDRRIT